MVGIDEESSVVYSRSVVDEDSVEDISGSSAPGVVIGSDDVVSSSKRIK